MAAVLPVRLVIGPSPACPVIDGQAHHGVVVAVVVDGLTNGGGEMKLVS
jgi:hypothetical protein